MDAASHAEHARSFDAGAGAYARARPSYPDDAVDALLPGSPRRVLDLGAGTGKLTAALVARGLDVVAVEPAPRMLAELTAALPGVEAHVATAEATGLPDASVDAVVCGQAWHWVDPVRAVPEVARVLRPGGTLGLVWNVRDDTVPWVRAVWDVAQRGEEREAHWDVDEVGGPFGPVQRSATAFVHETDRAGLLDLVASRSYVLVLPDAQRAALLAEVAHALDTHPDVGGADRLLLPYRTHCSVARLR